MVRLTNTVMAVISCHLLFLQVTVGFPNVKMEPRIVGGRDASIGEVPFLVQIWRNGIFICGGTRVSDYHIVTAAHCVCCRGMSPDQFTIVAGASKLSDTGIRANASEFIIHPDYNRRTRDMDIAVIKLKSRLRGPSVGLPSRCEVAIKPRDTVQLYGWGRTSFDYYFYSNQLQSVTVRAVDHDKCQHMYGAQIVLTESMFCATSAGKDSCTGDSGGPALVRGQFCGIVLGGKGCGNPNYPGIYSKINNTRIHRFLLDALS